MGIGQRLLGLARANLNALLERASGDARVEELTDDELEAELIRRKDRRRRDEVDRAAARSAAEAARNRGAQRAAERSTARSAARPTDGARHATSPSRPIADPRLARLYATLETPFGANFETVRTNFRRLMRRYHPDVNAGTPEKLKAATEKSATLTGAYNELEQLLTRRK